MRKGVVHCDDFFAHAHLKPQFFATLARDTFLQRFAAFPFAAGKFPQSAEQTLIQTLLNQ